jgi:hypothetical protein
MSTITLTRTGQRPLAFDGEEQFRATSRARSGPAETRWWELVIYRTADARAVMELNYLSQWETETEWSTAAVYPTMEALFDALEQHNPLDPVRGYPDAPHYHAKQRTLEQSLRAAWATLVSQAAAALNVVERLP